MSKLLRALAPMALVCTSPLLAQTDPQEGDEASSENSVAEAATDVDRTADKIDAKDDPGSKMKCKYQHVIGSRIPQKVCFTVDEWEEMRLKILEEARGMKNPNSSCPASGPC